GIRFPKNVEFDCIDVNATISREKGNNDSLLSQHWAYIVLLSVVIVPVVNISGNSSNLLNQ
ncbi:hypothetical protein F8C07_25345, partial [Escherichia coli]|uniref:hypothetical protein n=1 Tax=Escherichia coli TaxID=562 RepID=UPI002929E672